MVNTERLIRAVRRRPLLWNPTHAHYLNKVVRTQTWRLVCQDVVDGYGDLSDSQKNSWVTALVSKWKNLRDSYRRVLMTKKKDIGKKYYRKYIYEDSMKFMEPILDRQNIMSDTLELPLQKNIILENDEETASKIGTDKNDSDVSEEMDLDLDDGEASTVTAASSGNTKAVNTNNSVSARASTSKQKVVKDDETHAPQAKESWRAAAKKRTDNMDEQLMEILARSEEYERELAKDDDMMFFRSLLESVKQLPLAAKLKTRVEILQVVQRNLTDHGLGNIPHHSPTDENTIQRPNDKNASPLDDVIIENEGVQFKEKMPNKYIPVVRMAENVNSSQSQPQVKTEPGDDNDVSTA